VLVDNCDLLRPSCEAADLKQRLDSPLLHLRPGRLNHPRFDAGSPRQPHGKGGFEALRSSVAVSASDACERLAWGSFGHTRAAGNSHIVTGTSAHRRTASSRGPDQTGAPRRAGDEP
jgi:hypothetical protein